MTIFETIAGLTLLMIGLLASAAFLHQVDCYHQLTVSAVELRLKPLEHDERTQLSFHTRCSGILKKSQNHISIQSRSHHYNLSWPIKGKI